MMTRGWHWSTHRISILFTAAATLTISSLSTWASTGGMNGCGGINGFGRISETDQVKVVLEFSHDAMDVLPGILVVRGGGMAHKVA
jgi:hypothetical protein